MNDIERQILHQVRVSEGIKHYRLCAQVMADNLHLRIESLNLTLGELIESKQVTVLTYYPRGRDYAPSTMYFPANTVFLLNPDNAR